MFFTDLRTGKYVSVTFPDNCNLLCRNISEAENEQNCCDNFATCACGIATGHYACICPTGYFGSGFKGSCQRVSFIHLLLPNQINPSPLLFSYCLCAFQMILTNIILQLLDLKYVFRRFL